MIIRAGRVLRYTRNRRLVLLLATAGALALVALRGFDAYLGGFGSVGSLDFIEYWSAARLAMDGGNPYDPTALLAVERAAGWLREDPLLMWNPPWTLAIIMPLALLPFRVAAFFWLLLGLVLLLTSGFLLWRYVAPQDRRYWIGLLLAAGFVPAWFALHLGQISPWLLAGVVGFLWAERKGRDLVAGAALALLTIKPHVTFLFFLAAVWWISREGRWWILVGWLAALVGASGIVLLLDGNIFGEYLAAAASPPLYWVTPTLGAWLRRVFGAQRRWLQFLPSLLGILGLALWLWRRRGPWRWDMTAGPLLLASVATAAYGWSHDQLVLLPAVAAVVSRALKSSRRERTAVLGFLAAFQLALLVQNQCHVAEFFFVWHAWALVGLYSWVGARDRGDPDG